MNLKKILRTARMMSWVYRILSATVGLLTVRLINDCIGINGYGEIAYLLALITGVSAVDLGFLQALSRFVAQYGSEQTVRREQFWASCALFVVGLCVLQMLLIVLLSVTLGFRGQLMGLHFGEFLIIGLLMIVGNLMAASSAVYAGWQRYGMSSLAKISRSLFYLGTILILWALGDLSVRSVLWSNALISLVANLIVLLLLLIGSRSSLKWSWYDYPLSHWEQIKRILSYSLRGWLFTASTILVGSGTVFAAGLVLSPISAGQLQIALVIYTGVAAFITGTMVPLTTIRARLSDGSSDSINKVSIVTQKVIEETILLSAILLGFFLFHLGAVVELLVGDQGSDVAVLSVTQQLVMLVLIPGLAALPLFTFRFVLVCEEENACYSKYQFMGTVLTLVIGIGLAASSRTPQPLAASISAAFVVRAALAYKIGGYVLPGLRARHIFISLALLLVTCSGLNFLASNISLGWLLGGFGDKYLGAIIYLLLCGPLYVTCSRFGLPWRLLPPSLTLRRHIL